MVTDNARNMIKAFDMKLLLGVEDSEDSIDVDELEVDDSDAGDSGSEATPESSDDEVFLEPDDFVDYEGVQLPHQPCAAHTLQLVINDSIGEDASATDFLKYVQSVMVYFKRSTMWSDDLRKRTTVDMTLPAKTRWNSMLIMLDRFQKVRKF